MRMRFLHPAKRSSFLFSQLSFQLDDFQGDNAYSAPPEKNRAEIYFLHVDGYTEYAKLFLREYWCAVKREFVYFRHSDRDRCVVFYCFGVELLCFVVIGRDGGE